MMSSGPETGGMSNQHVETALMVPVIQTAGLNLLGCDKAAGSPPSRIEDDYALSNDMALLDSRVIEAIDTLRVKRAAAISAVAGLSQALEAYYEVRAVARDDALEKILAINGELSDIKTTEEK